MKRYICRLEISMSVDADDIDEAVGRLRRAFQDRIEESNHAYIKDQQEDGEEVDDLPFNTPESVHLNVWDLNIARQGGS